MSRMISLVYDICRDSGEGLHQSLAALGSVPSELPSEIHKTGHTFRDFDAQDVGHTVYQ